MGLSVDVSEHRTHSVSRADRQSLPSFALWSKVWSLPSSRSIARTASGWSTSLEVCIGLSRWGVVFANTLLTAASGTRRQQAETSGAHKEGTTVLAASCSRGQPHTGGQE